MLAWQRVPCQLHLSSNLCQLSHSSTLQQHAPTGVPQHGKHDSHPQNVPGVGSVQGGPMRAAGRSTGCRSLTRTWWASCALLPPWRRLPPRRLSQKRTDLQASSHALQQAVKPRQACMAPGSCRCRRVVRQTAHPATVMACLRTAAVGIGFCSSDLPAARSSSGILRCTLH